MVYFRPVAFEDVAFYTRTERGATLLDPAKSRITFLCHVPFFVFFCQSGETEALDLGAPISSLDGRRVVLERADPASSKGKTIRPRNTGLNINN